MAPWPTKSDCLDFKFADLALGTTGEHADGLDVCQLLVHDQGWCLDQVGWWPRVTLVYW